MKIIRVTCIGAATLPLDQLSPFQGALKELSKTNHAKLRGALIKYGFSFPFFVWRKEAKNYVIDGHQRLSTLLLLREEGYDIPPLPVVWIEAENEKEAKAKVLLAVAQFGAVTNQGLYEFISGAGIDVGFLKESINLPEINLGLFQQTYFSDTLANSGEGGPGGSAGDTCETCPHCKNKNCEQRSKK